VSLSEVIGPIPYRIALAGGWIDQPFVSRHDPDPPGSMVVVSVEPTSWYMERSGMATSTRRAALRLHPDGLPEGDEAGTVRRLYEEENRHGGPPSGSQDMIGLVYPGISRLDYDAGHEGGVYPAHVESCTDPEVARWLERVVHILAVAPRPERYDPLADVCIDDEWVGRLGRSGAACFDAIQRRDVAALGESVNECMRCWDALVPASFDHPALTVDWRGLLGHYRSRHPGAMCSASGGGYLYVISEDEVAGAFHPRVRLPRR